MSIVVGTRVRTLKGEWDSDENDQPRHANPGEIGKVIRVHTKTRGEPYYSVTFEPSECWVFLDHHEIVDPTQYEIL